MDLGFFQHLDLADRPRDHAEPRCGSCGLYKGCQSPKMEVTGEGRKGILVVGEAPGAREDEQNQPFVGKAGQLLQRFTAKAGIDLFRDCWVANSLRCRPPSNRTPTPKEIEWCRPFTVNDIRRLNPRVVILLGASALRSVVGWLLGRSPGGGGKGEEEGERGGAKRGKWLGWQIPSQRLNAWVCPTWHPSFVARMEHSRERELIDLWFLRDLKNAARLEGRPWPDGPPDYKSQVTVEMDPDKAARVLWGFMEKLSNYPLAFDYETDRLKPDYPDSRIVCCAVSDGTTTLAYPWHGGAVEVTKELLATNVPKIGANLKFEQRWTLRHLRVPVRNWAWDTVLAAHALDNRGGVTSVEFQAFVLLGQEPWDAAVAPYLTSRGSGNAVNRIRECPLPQLLQYCGMDALIEWKLAHEQARRLGVKL